MNLNYFECKVRYEKTLENGMNKNVTETYLVDALSYTEAEKRIIEEAQTFISGEFSIKDIKRSNHNEYVFTDDAGADKYYSSKLEFITLDEKSGKEKKTKYNMLVQAADLNDAMKRVADAMKDSVTDYNAVMIKETNILDVFKYDKEV